MALAYTFMYVLIGVTTGIIKPEALPEEKILNVEAINKLRPGMNQRERLTCATEHVVDILKRIWIYLLIGKGVGPGSALEFMMPVTALSVPEMILLRKAVKPRGISIFVTTASVGILLIAWMFNLLF